MTHAERLAVTLLLLLCSVESRAQAVDTVFGVRSGQEVRVTAPVRGWSRERAFVVRTEADTLIMFSLGAPETRVQRAEITRLEVAVGPQRRGTAFREMLMGGLVGFAVTKVFLDARYANDEWNTAHAVVVGVPVGVLVGGLLGHGQRTARWQDRQLR
jgi:hypothetical protein